MRASRANPCSITSAGFCSSRAAFIAPAYSEPGLGPEGGTSHRFSCLLSPSPVVSVLRKNVDFFPETPSLTTAAPGQERRMRLGVVLALASLYTAQGVPFGFATEYLPVVLREQGVSYAGIAA